ERGQLLAERTPLGPEGGQTRPPEIAGDALQVAGQRRIERAAHAGRLPARVRPEKARIRHPKGRNSLRHDVLGPVMTASVGCWAPSLPSRSIAERMAGAG